MRLIVAFAAALAILPSSSAFSTTLGYDPNLGSGSVFLTSFACSDGPNGLITKGFTTIGSLPSYPYVASSEVIPEPGWNSVQCGSCWKITYTDAGGAPHSITVTVIDHANRGFYTTQRAMDELTGGHAVEFGIVPVSAQAVSRAACGF